MKRALLILLCLAFWIVSRSQYISNVLEYKPAPGQHINAVPWGVPSSVNSIIGNITGSLSLGAFGGYVIFKFEYSVENNPDNPYGVDFTIFGNPMNNLSEPGIVYVMKDENQNGFPDDTWYELAGSDYFFSSSVQNYEVVYTNPHDTVAADVPWFDNFGNSGYIYSNTLHTQPYYPDPDSFPMINNDEYSLKGSSIQMPVDTLNPVFIKLPQRGYGYADNMLRGSPPYAVPDNPYTLQIENSGGDAFDIEWAIDTNGNYVDLDEIHFVKVQTSVQEDGGWLGEASTEITGAVDVEPNSSINGVLENIIIKDLPVILTSSTYQLEVFCFYQGRLQPQKNVSWSTSLDEAQIDENNLLTVTASGQLEITASLSDNPAIKTSVTTIVELSSAIEDYVNGGKIIVYPNPAKNVINIEGANGYRITVLEITGGIVYSKSLDVQEALMDISGLHAGVYILMFEKNGFHFTQKLVKK